MAPASVPGPWSLAAVPAGPAPGDLLDSDWLDALGWTPVEVPSTVATTAFGMPLPELYRDENVRGVQGLARQRWVYRTRIDVPAPEEYEESVLVLHGVDYRCAVYLDERLRTRHEGMFSAIEIPLADGGAGTHDLVVVVEPFEGDGGYPPAHLKARYTVEAYDFGAPLVTSGIWRDVEVVVRPRIRVLSASVGTELTADGFADVTVRVGLSAAAPGGELRVSLSGETASVALGTTPRAEVALRVAEPELWWPNGHGAAALVDLRLELDVPGSPTAVDIRPVGLRAISRRLAPGQTPGDFPLQLLINAEPVFQKGVNWVPPEATPGSIRPDRYRPYLEAFRDAGVNTIRVWGGGIRELDAFYDLADELGLMVLQDFPLSIRRPARTPAFLALVEQEVGAIVAGLAHHASIVGWCGGNELMTFWDAVTSGSEHMAPIAHLVREWIAADDIDSTRGDSWRMGVDGPDEPAMALMARLCDELDGTRPFQLTSAMEGQGEAHGTWSWNPRIGDHRFRDHPSLYDYWRQADLNMYSEASVSSIANLATIRDVFTGDPTMPTAEDPVWRFHKAFGAAWDGLDDLWLDLPSTRALFGELESLEDLVFANQWMQAEGGRFAIEEVRRGAPRTTGFIWWGVNEPWPALAGNALIDYFGRPKLGWRFLADAYRPTIATLRYENCVAEVVHPEVWVSHDGRAPYSGSYEVVLEDLVEGSSTLVARGTVELEPASSRRVAELAPLELPAGAFARVGVRLTDSDGVVDTRDYVFASAQDRVPLGGDRLAVLRRLASEL